MHHNCLFDRHGLMALCVRPNKEKELNRLWIFNKQNDKQAKIHV